LRITTAITSEAIVRSPVPVFGPAREPIPGITRVLEEGDTITVPGMGLDLSVLDVPGHTAGRIACIGRAADVPPRAAPGKTRFESFPDQGTSAWCRT